MLATIFFSIYVGTEIIGREPNQNRPSGGEYPFAKFQGSNKCFWNALVEIYRLAKEDNRPGRHVIEKTINQTKISTYAGEVIFWED